MTWVIGDVHGEKELFLKLLDRIAMENAGKEDEIYSVGDIIDRGNNSLDCIDICIDKGIKVVKGNHEDMCLDFYFMENRYSEGIWYTNGGDKTNNEFYYIIKLANKENKEELQAKIDKYISWMRSLPYYYLLENKYLICHGGIKGNLKLNCTGDAPDILWRRKDIRSNDYFQIVGHSPREKPLITSDYANIDTGSFYSGNLTAIHLPSLKTITVSDYR